MRSLAKCAALVAISTMCACAPVGTRSVSPEAPPGPDLVLAALTDRLPPRTSGALYAPPEPESLRPCCAFGLDLKVKVAEVPVPGFALETVRGTAEIGQHSYGAGLVQFASSPVEERTPEQPSRESNGIAYTCRGGFIDTAHLRDYADLTTYLAAQIRARLDAGGTIELAEQGGERRVVVRPLDRARVAAADRDAFAIAAAQWATFHLSVWREIATWYGHESVPPWPERISSFSLEDLYSNLLGTKLAGGVLATHTISNEAEYDRAMSAWIEAAFGVLGIVPKERAAAAMHAVEGVWWDAKLRVPDWKVTKRRQFQFKGTVTPWLIESASPPKAGSERVCSLPQSPFVLAVADHYGDVPIGDVVSIELRVSDRLASHGFPFPRRRDRRITNEDFAALVEAVRRETNGNLGGPSDHP